MLKLGLLVLVLKWSGSQGCIFVFPSIFFVTKLADWILHFPSHFGLPS